MTSITDRLDAIFDRQAGSSKAAGLVMRIEHPSSGFTWSRAAGFADAARTRPMTTETPIFLASITKLYTAALVMRLAEKAGLDLDAPFRRYLDDPAFDRLHVTDGTDRTGDITVRHLLAHASGLPDYYEDRQADGTAMVKQVLSGQDRGLSRTEVFDLVRGMRPKFPPGARGRAHYSDTNYAILSEVIAKVGGSPYESAIRTQILDPLDLRQTFLLTEKTLDRYGEAAALWSRDQPLVVPRMLASGPAEGAMIATVTDAIAFARALFDERIVPATRLAQMQGEWRRIFFPFRYGLGMMRIDFPWYVSPFHRIAPQIGHSGSLGSVLFHAPSTGTFIAGTTNQGANRTLGVRLMTRLLAAMPDPGK